MKDKDTKDELDDITIRFEKKRKGGGDFKRKKYLLARTRKSFKFYRLYTAEDIWIDGGFPTGW